MSRYALLLRAINVGGRKLPMADLRTLLTELGHTDVKTILASGQAVVTSDRKGADIAGELEQRLVKEFGLRSEVMVRSGAELAAIIKANPYRGADEAGNKHALVFMREKVNAAQLKQLEAQDWSPDEFVVSGQDIYLHLPNGFAESKLSLVVVKLKGNPSTTRNWNTVRKLADLTA